MQLHRPTPPPSGRGGFSPLLDGASARGLSAHPGGPESEHPWPERWWRCFGRGGERRAQTPLWQLRDGRGGVSTHAYGR